MKYLFLLSAKILIKDSRLFANQVAPKDSDNNSETPIVVPCPTSSIGLFFESWYKSISSVGAYFLKCKAVIQPALPAPIMANLFNLFCFYP